MLRLCEALRWRWIYRLLLILHGGGERTCPNAPVLKEMGAAVCVCKVWTVNDAAQPPQSFHCLRGKMAATFFRPIALNSAMTR